MEGKAPARAGEKEDQDVGHEELGEGDRRERGGIGEPVEEGVAEQRREDAQHQRQGHRDGGGIARERQRVAKATPDQVGHGLPVGEAFAEDRRAARRQPVDVAHMHRVVEAQPFAQRGDGFGRGRLAEDFLREVSGQKLGPEEDDQRDHEQRHEAKPQTLRDHDPDM
jgi:hypothetical protein